MKVLFIADGSLDRPLLHSQGLPLLRRLAERGWNCHIISFEDYPGAGESELGADLSRRGIHWMPITGKSGTGRMERVWMIVKGTLGALQLARREKIDLIHCRSYRPGVMGSLIKTLTGVGFLFDMRGFLIDEQILLGRWKPEGIIYRIARLLERWCLLNADVVITTSPQFSQRVRAIPYMRRKPAQGIISIANSVDVQKFYFDQNKRDSLQKRLGWEDRFVIAFAGEARSWEGFSEIFSIYKTMKKQEEKSLLALFVYGDTQLLQEALEQERLGKEDVCLMTIPPEEMPGYLCAVDIGVVFRKDSPFTREIASPIKFGEYLACGLPVVINPGVGDTERIVETYRVGVVVDPGEAAALEVAVGQVLGMVKNDSELRERCRRAAEIELSLDGAVEAYLKAYEIVTKRRRGY